MVTFFDFVSGTAALLLVLAKAPVLLLGIDWLDINEGEVLLKCPLACAIGRGALLIVKVFVELLEFPLENVNGGIKVLLALLKCQL